MKRSFVYLALALILSLLLCACGDMTNRGNVTASPWPDVTEPALPLPSASVVPTVTPDTGSGMTGSGVTGNGGSTNSGTAGGTVGSGTGSNTGIVSSASPSPAEMMQ